MNKIFITLAVISFVEIHMSFQPKDPRPLYDDVTKVVIGEYESACIRKTIELSGDFYTCKDLKKYLVKRGYE